MGGESEGITKPVNLTENRCLDNPSLKPDQEFKFVLPSWPPSVNSLYQIIYSQRRVELKPEVRLWKTQAKELIPAWAQLRSTERLLSVELKFCGAWWHGNGKLKKTDVQNMVKVTLDALAEKNGFDDSQVFECVEKKQASLKEYVEGTVRFIGEEKVGTD